MSAPSDFATTYGPWAVVAGSAVGLGAEYARQIAETGINVVMLDRDAATLATTAAELRTATGVEIREATIELGAPDVIEQVGPVVGGLEVGLLVYNAAIGTVAPFMDMSPAHCAAMLDVNCRGPMLLIHALAPQMVERGRGGIILMSSMSGRMGSKQLAVYAGTKAFDLVFAHALWAELKDHGVDVLAMQPGSTRTPGWQSSQEPSNRGPGPHVMEPADVVREALATLGKQPAIIAGEQNRKAAAAMDAMPLAEAIELMSSITKDLIRND